MTFPTSQNEDINRSHLNIVMYSDEDGEVIVEGDEEEEQLPNGTYEYDEEGVFEIDDLPTEHHTPSSPDIQVRYYTPINETSRGLSQSVMTSESDHFMRSIRSEENQEHSSFESNHQVSNNHDISSITDTNTIYSQSAPVISFLSDFYLKPLPNLTDPIQKDDHSSTITQVTVPIHENKSILDQQTEVVQEETKRETDSISISATEEITSQSISPYEPENNLKMIIRSIDEDSLDAWNDLATAYFGINKDSCIWQTQINFSHERLWLRNGSIALKYINMYAVLIKVTGLSKRTRHRDIQRHFFSCNVLSIRYICMLCCAYITYRNYDQMVEGIINHNGTSLRGNIIRCRPSFFEEMNIDNETNSYLLYHSSKSPLCPNKSNTFIPERHGILQYDTTEKTMVPLSEYHPRYLISFDSSQKKIQYPDYASKTIPVIKLVSEVSVFSSHYVIIKPWLNSDVQASQKYQYWSVTLEKAFRLNYLFRNSFEVNLLFSVKGTKAYQGYAVMKSEVLDLKLLTDEDTIGTVFEGKGTRYQAHSNGRKWRYVFRVEWKSTKRVRFNSTKNYSNPWFGNFCVNFSKDCTMVEPTVGKKMVEIISSC